jgi:ribonuclease VapC
LIGRLVEAQERVTHGISVWEAMAAITRLTGDPAEGRLRVLELLEITMTTVVPISENETMAAFEAYRRYGKASGHQAQLNLGDCFSYGVAEVHDMPLLYKGLDFMYTLRG